MVLVYQGGISVGWMQLLRGWEVYSFVYGNREKQHCHTTAAELDFRYQEHHCIPLHFASLNLALSIPSGLALGCVCMLGVSQELGERMGCRGSWLTCLVPSCQSQGPLLSLRGKEEKACPQLERCIACWLWQGEWTLPLLTRRGAKKINASVERIKYFTLKLFLSFSTLQITKWL